MIEINRNPSIRQLRQFAALWFPAFGALVGFLIYRRLDAHTAAFAVWGVTAAVSVIGLASPPFMRRVFVGMMTLTFPIGWVISNIILLLLYYLVLTPIGLAVRLTGRDPMQRHLERSGETYWLPRNEETPTSRYFRQY